MHSISTWSLMRHSHLVWQFCRMDSIFATIGSHVEWDVKSLLLFAMVFIITADYIKNRRPVGFPPGPRAFPIVGNIFTLDQNRTHESLMQVPRHLEFLQNTPELIWLLFSWVVFAISAKSSPSWQRNMGMCTAYGLVRGGP